MSPHSRHRVNTTVRSNWPLYRWPSATAPTASATSPSTTFNKRCKEEDQHGSQNNDCSESFHSLITSRISRAILTESAASVLPFLRKRFSTICSEPRATTNNLLANFISSCSSFCHAPVDPHSRGSDNGMLLGRFELQPLIAVEEFILEFFFIVIVKLH